MIGQNLEKNFPHTEARKKFHINIRLCPQSLSFEVQANSALI